MRTRRLASARSSQTSANKASSRSSATTPWATKPRSLSSDRTVVPECSNDRNLLYSESHRWMERRFPGACFLRSIPRPSRPKNAEIARYADEVASSGSSSAGCQTNPGGSSCTRPAKSACRTVESGDRSAPTALVVIAKSRLVVWMVRCG